MNQKSNFQKGEHRISKSIRNDFRQTKIREEFKSGYKDIKQYFLSGERKAKLDKMNPVKRFFVLPFWIIKAMYFRLTPFRRVLLFIGLIFLLFSGSIDANGNSITFSLNISAILVGFIFLFILALELKDKLLAKSELEEGRAIQLALMPEQSPLVNGWDTWLFTKSANDVGCWWRFAGFHNS